MSKICLVGPQYFALMASLKNRIKYTMSKRCTLSDLYLQSLMSPCFHHYYGTSRNKLTAVCLGLRGYSSRRNEALSIKHFLRLSNGQRIIVRLHRRSDRPRAGLASVLYAISCGQRWMTDYLRYDPSHDHQICLYAR